MVVNRRKKVHKYRAHSNHGGGARKKRRGHGSKGGTGRAGTGKRAGTKKMGMPPQLGKFGFTPLRHKKEVHALNVEYFTPEKMSRLLEEKKISKEQGVFIVDLASLGYQKLIGSGHVSLKLKIIVEKCSAHAREKIEAAGGTVNTKGGDDNAKSDEK